MTQPTLSCDEVEELLPLVADGTLDVAGDPTLFAHLADCERCQQSLVTHDLIAVSLPRVTRLPEPRIMRPWWQRALPAAAAAAALMMGGTWLVVGSHETVSVSALKTAPLVVASPGSVTPGSSTPGAATVSKAVVPKAVAHPGAIDVEIEVVALPGSTTAHPHYLVRRGEQVLLVTPQVAPVEAPTDAKPASFSPSRY